MIGKEMLDANPKAASKVHDFYLNQMLNALDNQDLPDHFKEYLEDKGISMDNIADMMDANPRQLFDVFDEYDIIISITYNRKSSKFCYFVNEDKNKLQFSTRKEADKDAVSTALTLLETKLNPLEKDNKES